MEHPTVLVNKLHVHVHVHVGVQCVLWGCIHVTCIHIVYVHVCLHSLFFSLPPSLPLSLPLLQVCVCSDPDDFERPFKESKMIDAHVDFISIISPPPQRRPGQDPYSHIVILSFCLAKHSYMLCTWFSLFFHCMFWCCHSLIPSFSHSATAWKVFWTPFWHWAVSSD